MKSRQKTITFIIAAGAAIALASFSAIWANHRYEISRNNHQNSVQIQTDSSTDANAALAGTQPGAAQSGTVQTGGIRKINISFWDDFSEDEATGLITLAAIIGALVGFCLVWLVSFAIALIFKI
jgi:ABC-type multidrug transport system permease subunit